MDDNAYQLNILIAEKLEIIDVTELLCGMGEDIADDDACICRRNYLTTTTTTRGVAHNDNKTATLTHVLTPAQL